MSKLKRIHKIIPGLGEISCGMYLHFDLLKRTTYEWDKVTCKNCLKTKVKYVKTKNS